MSETIYGVYTHSRPDGRIFYVGKGTKRRSKWLSRKGWHKNIVLKYGRKNIIVCFMPCISEYDAFRKEEELIAFYKSQGVKLVNHTDGGEGPSGNVWTEEQKERHKAKTNEPEHRKLLQRRAKEFYKNNPEAKEELSRRLAELSRSEKRRKEHSARMKELFSDPAYYVAYLERVRIFTQGEEFKNKISEKSKLNWSDPEYKKAMKAKAKARSSSDKYKETFVNNQKRARKENPNYLDSLKKLWSSEEFSKMRSSEMKERWKKPEYREKMAAIRKARQINRNDSENYGKCV